MTEINLKLFKAEWLRRIATWPEARHAGSCVGWYNYHKGGECWSALGLGALAAGLQPWRGMKNSYYFHFKGRSFKHYPGYNGIYSKAFRESPTFRFIKAYRLDQLITKAAVTDLRNLSEHARVRLNTGTKRRGVIEQPLIIWIDQLELGRSTFITIHELVQKYYIVKEHL